MRLRQDTFGLGVTLLSLLLTGCGAGYYAQSIEGHLSLMAKRTPIEALLKESSLPAQRREALETALQVRAFASHKLNLPDNGSYRQYVELDRPAVVWNVVATPEFSLTPKQWCFPIVGCMSYRGYFAKEAAQTYATQLEQAGLDVSIGGATAYSTLGWFDDPLLSTMLDRGDILMAEVIFHELAHQRLYVKSDSVFNEAFASAVAEHGVRRWLAATRPTDLPRYTQWLKRQNQFLKLLQQTADELHTLYARTLPEQALRDAKKNQFSTLRARYADLKIHWEGYAGFDAWFHRPLNNARLTSIGVYRDRVPDFHRWIKDCNNDLQQFYRAMERLAAKDKATRHAALMAPANCSTQS